MASAGGARLRRIDGFDSLKARFDAPPAPPAGVDFRSVTLRQRLTLFVIGMILPGAAGVPLIFAANEQRSENHMGLNLDVS
jgi:hypothetical protein